jgi:arylsulfatase A-like enzyme
MNVVIILLDSLNFHCLQPYGATHVQTPNLQRFAERSVVFENHFVGSLPCMPARRELFTGRQEFLWRGWGHIEPWDRHLAVDAARAGAVTQMITDHYHYWENGAHGYFEPFNGVDFIRGHELDMVETAPVSDVPAWAKSINAFRSDKRGGHDGWGTNYCANTQRWQDETQFPCAQVMRNSAQWLRKNQAHDKFMLWIEGFDPHEPHFLPEPYRSMYFKGKPSAQFNCWPPYQNREQMLRFVAQASDEELAWIRAQYYGKVTMVDRWLGEFLDSMDALNLWRNTAVIVTTDHGHDLCYDRALHPIVYGKQYPHPESHARIPLLVWHPDHPGRSRRCDALTCAVDVNATARELLGCQNCDGPHGRSLLPLIRGETASHREHVLYGTFAQGATLSTREWTLAQGATGKEPCYWHSTTAHRVSPEMTSGRFIPGVDIPQWRVPAHSPRNGCYLWDRSRFSLTPPNLIEKHPDRARELRALLREAIAAVPGPPECLRYLGLE